MSLAPSTEQLLSWEALSPTLQLTELPPPDAHFFALQPRARSALQSFSANSERHLLILKTHETTEAAKAIQDFIQARFPEPLPVCGVHYTVEQADSFSFARVSAAPAQSAEDNFAAKSRVETALYGDYRTFFGAIRQHPVSKDIELIPGLVHKLNQGTLIISLSLLLSQFDVWTQLKHILTCRRFDWYSAHPFKSLPCDIPSYPLALKVVLLGNREELALFSELEPELYSLGDYGEIDSYFSMESVDNQRLWAAFVQGLAKKLQLPPLDLSGLNKLYQLLVRDSEDRSLVSVSVPLLTEILSRAAQADQSSRLTAVHFEQYFQQKQFEHSFLREQSYAEIFNEQVYVATEGEMIGQINGLSVIEYPGSPLVFGEPSRISCIARFGDGEILDIDRKNELAGNLHGKGMMIAEACLAGLLNVQSQLPFSASLVFEQSYGDIDGDSASLAVFCALISALSDMPLPQSVAVTGAIDQFGQVHAVGGVNHKIEGFFAICQRRGFNGQQGVLIPATTLHQLSLSAEVQSAVKNGEFFIWAVDDIFQAAKLLFKRDLVEEDGSRYNSKNLPLSLLIAQRIEQKADPIRPRGFWQWFKEQSS